MKKILTAAFIIIYSALNAFSQDVIVLKNSGERIQAKVTEVGITEIKYKNFDNQDGPVYSISKSDVDMILYVNGSKDVFIEEPATIDSTKTKNENSGNTANPVYTVNPSSNEELFNQGQKDAMTYYRGYRGASSSTLLVSIIATPILGLIPAIGCSVTTPHGRHLMCPNRDLIQNRDYYTGYTMRAKKIKSKKIWTNWGAACGIYIVLSLLSS